ncbi:MAG TPA: NADH-quinone oxidoreductase subunit M [Cellvibrio sp.]|nr:NADH-quinone oxidoreductase subunit M [Cellvibrio sp.]
MLTWLILIPFIGGFLSWLAEYFGSRSPRWIALGTMFVLFVLTLYLWLTHDYSLANLNAGQGNSVWVDEFHRGWIPSLGISFHLALDGLSLLMLLLTAFLGMLAVICSWSEVQRKIGFFHLNLLWIIGAVVGVFLAMDMFLFFFFWEMMLIPMYFLISLWGHKSDEGKGRVEAATKFFIYTQSSGLLLLLAIIGLVYVHFAQTGDLTFAYEALRNTTMSAEVEFVLMLGFFIAFAVKFPVVPFHSWLPDAHSQAPTAGSVDLAGILLKTAAYGMLRFAIPFFPNASETIAPVAMWLGVAGVIYGAFVAYGQDDIKRLIAYTSISHMGFVLIGIYSFNQIALQGVVVQMLAHGLSAAGLFIMSGQLYERLKTRDLRKMGGLSSRMAGLPPIAMFFTAASLGLPGLGNFVGELLVLLGAYKVDPVVVIAATSGLVLSAVYSLIMLQRAFHGAASSNETIPGLNARELAMMLSLMFLLVWLGFYPQPVLDTSAAVMNSLAQFVATTLTAAQ